MPVGLSSRLAALVLMAVVPVLAGCEKPKAEAASEPAVSEVSIVTVKARHQTIVH